LATTSPAQIINGFDFLIFFVNNIIMGYCKMAQEGKIPTVKIEFRKNDKVIIRIPFKRRWNLSKTTKNNIRPEGCIYEKFAYLPHMAGYTKLTSYIPELSEIALKRG